MKTTDQIIKSVRITLRYSIESIVYSKYAARKRFLILYVYIQYNPENRNSFLLG